MCVRLYRAGVLPYLAMDAANVVLLSGGVDSVALMHALAETGEPIQALFIDYGQRGARHERVAAEHFCEPLGVELIRFDLASVGETFRNVQARKAHVPLPHRNLVALALGVSYAANLGACKLYLAITREDTLAYPSASHPFLAQFRLLMGLIGNVGLATPYIDLSKAEVVRRGEEIGIDFSMAYSCMVGQPIHCGRCRQCLTRRAAFREAGLEESADFYRV
jgi:7-cyano-7-deazaguanine synthase